MPLVHHELCFGCGRVNLFGLLLEAEPAGEDAVTARCFLKQDHQGPERGHAHPGILATALTEAMALACGPGASALDVQTEFTGPVPIGGFLELEARVERREGPSAYATATATAERRIVARGRGSFRCKTA